MKLISIVTPCYNEEENIEEIYIQVKKIFSQFPNYAYEHIFIDNASTDKTLAILKEISTKDRNIKIIVNARNFGQIRSPYYGLLQAKGDAIILVVADLQDPPELIASFIEKWESGFKIVVGVKPTTDEKFPLSVVRRLYYKLLARISELKLIKNFTGFGLYDKSVIDLLKQMNDANPYLRGLISEIGFPICEIPFKQPIRERGKSKNNFYSLFDIALLGVTKHSKFPIRIATMGGFFFCVINFLLAFTFFILKLFFWDQFPIGTASLLVGFFFFSSMILFFIGILGEYILTLHTEIIKRPLVIEKERINF